MPNHTDFLNQKTFYSFTGNESYKPLPSLMSKLYVQQTSSWPQFSAAADALENVRTREIERNGLSVKLQFNPARIISTAVSIDRKSRHERPCFLCIDNLPKAQKGILYRHNFLILCNPYPILKRHYTLSHIKHMPQSFSNHIDDFLHFAKDISPDYNVFYNGPLAGASAPDHQHFQALPTGLLPFETELHKNRTRHLIKSLDGNLLFTMALPGRQVIIVEGKSIERLTDVLMTIINRFKMAISTLSEPIMNLLCFYLGHAWQVIIFLRRKHRPDVYYLQGEDRILVSPGLVEMGGLMITPIEKDFCTLDAEMIEDIYKEVSLDPKIFQQVINAL